jgi:LPXTG-motif cell wall-anchored protein
VELALKDVHCTAWLHALSMPQRLSSIQHNELEANWKNLHCTKANIKSSIGLAVKELTIARRKQRKEEWALRRERSKEEYALKGSIGSSPTSTYLILGLVAAAGIGLYFLYFRR